MRMNGLNMWRSGRMESLNKIELKGIVGSVKSSRIGESYINNLSVATNYTYKDEKDNILVETTWHHCVYFSKEELSLNRGDNVELSGRIRERRYIDPDGNEKPVYEIIVNKLNKLN